MRAVRTGSSSIAGRLIRLFAIQALLGLGALSFVIYGAMVWSLSEKADAELGRKAELVKHLVSEATKGGELTMRHKLDEFLIGYERVQVTLFGKSDEVTYRSPGHVPQQASQRFLKVELSDGSAQQRFVRASIALDRSDDLELLGGLAALLCGATVIGAILLSVSGASVVRKSLEPLQGLTDQMRSLRAAQPGKRLELLPPIEELQPWIEQFNDVLGRLEASYQQLESFNADVAHELRTPLTTLIGQTELTLNRARTPCEMRETLASNLEETHRLAAIINDMLFLARADSGAHAGGMHLADLRSHVERVMDFHEGELADANLSSDIRGDCSASVEPGLFRRAVSNLLSNAVRYAQPGSQVLIHLRVDQDLVWIEVSNRGTDIPPEELPRLFDRFYRAQTCRTGSDLHHGLGLAIVAAIAKMHGGSTRGSSTSGITTVGFSLLRVGPDPSVD